MPVINAASKFFSNSKDHTNTNQITLYTVPSNHSAVVKALIVSNTDSTNRNVTVKWLHASASATYSILENHQITANDFEAVLNDNVPLYLHAGDIVYATAATADTILTTISVEEYYDPNR